MPADGQLAAVADAIERARSHVSDVLLGAKRQAVSVSLRASDPTPLAGARPGAVATVVVGCLALGGGAATYCAQPGVDPAGVFAGLKAPAAKDTPGCPKSK
jgi:hypothetical protein